MRRPIGISCSMVRSTATDRIRRWTDSRLVVGILVCVVSALYLASVANEDWIAGDEGALAHSAERTLSGELPHRDYDAIYTGGLSYVNALAFQLFGTSLHSLRIPILVVAIASIPAIFATAARFTNPAAAGLIALVCVAWSLPNYFASMGSWYNLYLTIFGVLALLRFFEDGRRRWAFAAGLCGGISFLFKSTGLGFAVAAALAIVFHEQERSLEDAPQGRATVLQVCIGLGLMALVVALGALVAQRPTVTGFLLFFVPGSTCVGVLVSNEWCLRDRSGRSRWRLLARWGTPLVIGTILPIALFALPYAASESLGDLYQGVFVVPRRRFDHIELALPSALWLLGALPFALLLFAGFRKPSVPVHPGATVALVVALIAALVFGGTEFIYGATWGSVRPTTVLVAIASLVLLTSPAARGLPQERRTGIFLLAATAAFASLVQVPFPAGVYFCYIAPLTILAAGAVIACQPAAPRVLLGCVAGFYGIFALVWNVPASTLHLGFRHVPISQWVELAWDRGGIRVAARDAVTYGRLVGAVRERSQPGSTILAIPDIPHVYFLTGRSNPTRTLYDLFDSDYGESPRVDRLLAALAAQEVDVVVLRHRRSHSQLPPALVRALEQRYPEQLEIRPFTVRWREPRRTGHDAAIESEGFTRSSPVLRSALAHRDSEN